MAKKINHKSEAMKRQITLVAPEYLLDELAEKAEKEQVSKSEFIRRRIREWSPSSISIRREA